MRHHHYFRSHHWQNMPRRVLVSAILLLLTACMTTHSSLTSPITQKDVKAHLVCPRIAHWMKAQDHEKLRSLVNTAQLQQTIHWRQGIAHYSFSSQAIFIDQYAHPCRVYQFMRRSLIARTMVCLETACRDIKGQWQRLDPAAAHDHIEN